MMMMNDDFDDNDDDSRNKIFLFLKYESRTYLPITYKSCYTITELSR